MSTQLVRASEGAKAAHSARALCRAMRPHQWVKNLLLFGGLIFSKSLFDPVLLMKSVQGFFLFCFASSAVYLLNDLRDIENDRLHPKKRLRPLASGDLSPRLAIAGMLTLVLIAANRRRTAPHPPPPSGQPPTRLQGIRSPVHGKSCQCTAR